MDWVSEEWRIVGTLVVELAITAFFIFRVAPRLERPRRARLIAILATVALVLLEVIAYDAYVAEAPAHVAWTGFDKTHVYFVHGGSTLVDHERLRLIIIEQNATFPIPTLRDRGSAVDFASHVLSGTRRLFLVDAAGNLLEGSVEVFDELWPFGPWESGRDFEFHSNWKHPEVPDRLLELAKKHHDKALLAFLGEKE